MTGTRYNKLLRLFVLAPTVAMVLLGVVPPAPARASHGTDLLNAAPGGWTAATSGEGSDVCPVLLSCDANDATGRLSNVATSFATSFPHGGVRNMTLATTTFNRSSGVSSLTINSIRVKAAVCQTGYPSYSSCGAPSAVRITGLLILVQVSGVCNATNDEHFWRAQASSTAMDTGEVELDVPFTTNGSAGLGTLCLWFETPGGVSSVLDGAQLVIYSVEYYNENAELVRPFEDYVYGLRMSHPPFQRLISWWWKIDWSGVWSVTDSDDTLLAGGLSGGAKNVAEYVSIQCTPVCGTDTYTIHVHEDGYAEVTYEVDGDADGYLLAPSGNGILSFSIACYNAALDDCASPLAGAADSLYVRFTVVRPGTATQATDIDGTVSIGRWDREAAEACSFVGSPVTTSVLSFPGTYTQGVSAWDQGAGFFDDSGNQLVLIRWDSAIEPAYYDCDVHAVDVAGGTTSTTENPQTPVSVCAPGDLACGIGQAVTIGLDGLFGAAEDVWTDATGAAHDAAMEKLPFAYIVLAVDGISAQLVALSAEVEDTTTCPGLTINAPIPYLASNLDPAASTMPFVVLTCAQLEETPLGSTWYQTVRGALDPALWLLYGWAQVKRLQPKASLNG